MDLLSKITARIYLNLFLFVALANILVYTTCPHFFWYFFKMIFEFFYKYFSFPLTWDPMGVKISKRYSSLKLLLNLFKPCFLKFLLSCPHKSTVLDFWNFEFAIFHDFFFFSFPLTWDPVGAKSSKSYSSLKSLLNLFKPFLKFLLHGPHKSVVLDVWNFELLIFDIFLKFSIIPYGEAKHLNYLENERP